MTRWWPAWLLLGVFLAGWIWETRFNAVDEIEYRGQKIKLSKRYSDFSQYKNDPENILPSETARVQELVMEAPIANVFSTRLEVFQATQDIVFPGYGAGGGRGRQPDGSELIVVTIEIPRAEKNRYLVFQERNGQYERIDDFVDSELAEPIGIREENGFYIYTTRDGVEALRRPAVHAE